MCPQAELTENDNLSPDKKCIKVKAAHFNKPKTNLTPIQQPQTPKPTKKKAPNPISGRLIVKKMFFTRASSRKWREPTLELWWCGWWWWMMMVSVQRFFVNNYYCWIKVKGRGERKKRDRISPISRRFVLLPRANDFSFFFIFIMFQCFDMIHHCILLFF